MSLRTGAVACDNTRHCEAIGSQDLETDDLNPIELWISRDAGPYQPLTGRIIAIDDTQEEFKGELLLKIGNENYHIDTQIEIPSQTLTQMLSKMVAENEAVAMSGQQEWHLSLQGLHATLLKIDDLQGRAGTQRALVKKGTQAECSVPAKIDAPLITLAPEVEQRESDDSENFKISRGCRNLL